MKIAIVGSGHIGANIGLRAAEAGHQIAFSFSRDDKKLRELAEKAGAGASAAPVDCAIEHADVVVFSVPWDQRLSAIPDASLLNGKIVVDTTNQYGRDGVAPLSGTAIQENMALFPGAKFAKAFNTLTSQFQVDEKERSDTNRHAMFYAGEDDDALEVARSLIEAVGFKPMLLGGWNVVELLEAPRRSGSVYGEAYSPQNAQKIVSAAQEDMGAARRLAIELKETE